MASIVKRLKGIEMAIAWNGVPWRLYVLEASALAFGILTLWGLVVLIIRRFSRAGRIYGAGAGCYYRTNRPTELLLVVDHFDRHPLRGEKQTAYRIWREMVYLRATHHGSRPPKRLDDLAWKLSRPVRKGGK